MILRCLNYEAPESWRERIQSRVDNLLRHWSRASPNDSDPLSLNPYIDRGQQIINHPNTANEIKSYMAERVITWESEKLQRWNRIADGWINEAKKSPYEDGIELLSSHMAESIPDEVRRTLEDARNNIYNSMADQWLNKYGEDRKQLQALLNRFPSMPLDTKDRITKRIDFLYEKYLEGKIRDIRSAKSIKELSDNIKSLGGEAKVRALAQAISVTLTDLTNSRLNELKSEAGAMMRNNNFAEGRQYVAEESSRLQQEVRAVIDDKNLTGRITAQAQELTASLMRAHYTQCKGSFSSRKNTNSTRDIRTCLEDVRRYLNTWPEAMQTREGAEAKQAAEFLEAIQGGIRGELRIVEGDFRSEDSFSDTPDMKIVINIGDDSWVTRTIEDSTHPKFDASLSVTWSVEMSTITFIGVEVDPMFDDTVFTYSITPRGFRGYRSLTGQLTNSGNSLTIRFEPERNIPDCPW